MASATAALTVLLPKVWDHLTRGRALARADEMAELQKSTEVLERVIVRLENDNLTLRQENERLHRLVRERTP